jgi:hypothetical protein
MSFVIIKVEIKMKLKIKIKIKIEIAMNDYEIKRDERLEIVE